MKYSASSAHPCDLRIELCDEMLKRTRENYPDLSMDELGYIFSGFHFSGELPLFDGFCLHASAVVVEDCAVLFSAASGVGKSTHTGLWVDHFGERAYILNDDKPAVRWVDGGFFVYGTPWSGKFDLSVNTAVPLKAIVFLERAEKNFIHRMDFKAAVKGLLSNSIRSQRDLERTNKLLDLFDQVLSSIEIFQMGCNVTQDAVRLAYEAIFKTF